MLEIQKLVCFHIPSN